MLQVCCSVLQVCCRCVAGALQVCFSCHGMSRVLGVAAQKSHIMIDYEKTLSQPSIYLAVCVAVRAAVCVAVRAAVGVAVHAAVCVAVHAAVCVAVRAAVCVVVCGAVLRCVL